MTYGQIVLLAGDLVIPFFAAIAGAVVALLGNGYLGRVKEKKLDRRYQDSDLLRREAEACQGLIGEWRSASSAAAVNASGFLSGKINYFEYFGLMGNLYAGSGNNRRGDLKAKLYNFFPEDIFFHDQCLAANAAISRMVHEHKTALGEHSFGRFDHYEMFAAAAEDADEKFDLFARHIGEELRKRLTL